MYLLSQTAFTCLKNVFLVYKVPFLMPSLILATEKKNSTNPHIPAGSFPVSQQPEYPKASRNPEFFPKIGANPQRIWLPAHTRQPPPSLCLHICAFSVLCQVALDLKLNIIVIAKTTTK